MFLLQERDDELRRQDPTRKPSHFFNSYFFEKMFEPGQSVTPRSVGGPAPTLLRDTHNSYNSYNSHNTSRRAQQLRLLADQVVVKEDQEHHTQR